MPDNELAIYSIGHIVLDYAKYNRRSLLCFTDIEDYLFSIGIELSEARLLDILKEMSDAGWIYEIDLKKQIVSFNSLVIACAA